MPTPTAAVMETDRPSIVKGSAAAARSRSATPAQCRGSTSTHNTTNSSPPRRAAGVLRAQQGADTLSELLQDQVTGGVAVAIVDRLEPVEVDEQQAVGAGMSPATGMGMTDPLSEQKPVRQACQGIVQRVVQQSGLDGLAVGDVLLVFRSYAAAAAQARA